MRQPSFEQLFAIEPTVRAQAPGRVNLMGDHTDYNGGFVLPAAIPQTTRVELAPVASRIVKVWSAAYPASPPLVYELGGEARRGDWSDYIKGMTVVLAQHGLREGFNARIESDVPVGSGLSSSAALEIALGRAVREAFGLKLSDIELATAGRRAENNFVGAPVGIMDQMACSFATPAAPIVLDTRSLEFEHVPLPPGVALVVIDSGIAHRHASGGYAERRRECAEAARRLHVRELRDVDDRDPAVRSLPEPLARRTRHVLNENRRVHDTVAALRAGDIQRAGALFVQSHASLRDEFEVSVPDIDKLVEIALAVQGVYGARLTGGGFGGSVVALSRTGSARQAGEAAVKDYEYQTGNRGVLIVPAA